MGRFSEEGPKNILGVPEEGSHLTAVGAAWSIMFLFKAAFDNLSSLWKRSKLLQLSSLNRSCRVHNENGLAQVYGRALNCDGLEIHMNNWLAIPAFKREHHHVSWGQEPGKKETKTTCSTEPLISRWLAGINSILESKCSECVHRRYFQLLKCFKVFGGRDHSQCFKQPKYQSRSRSSGQNFIWSTVFFLVSNSQRINFLDQIFLSITLGNLGIQNFKHSKQRTRFYESCSSDQICDSNTNFQKSTKGYSLALPLISAFRSFFRWLCWPWMSPCTRSALKMKSDVQCSVWLWLQ